MLTAPPSMKVFVVGLAGGTASGKTSIAHAVAAHFRDNCLLLSHDRYYRTAPKSANFDHPDSLDTSHLVDDLRRLTLGTPTRLPQYDFARHAQVPREQWESVQPRPLILVEGILVLADEALRAALNLRVFVDAPDALRLERRLQRDQAERGRSAQSVLDQYRQTVKPMYDAFVSPSAAYADLVLDGTRPLAEGTAAVVAAIRRQPPRKI